MGNLDGKWSHQLPTVFVSITVGNGRHWAKGLNRHNLLHEPPRRASRTSKYASLEDAISVLKFRQTLRDESEERDEYDAQFMLRVHAHAYVFETKISC